MYYPNLLGEMAKRKVKQKDLATVIGKEEQTISKKMNGSAIFTLDEARKISEYLKTELTIEELFKQEEE